MQFTGDYAQLESEMDAVGKSGADLYRINILPSNTPANDWSLYDRVFERAAEKGVTILPVIVGRLDGQLSLPSAGELAPYSTWLWTAVTKYGYGGTFWSQHPNLPAKPATAWEIWNEPNLLGIPAGQYGGFAAWAGSIIQSGSEATGQRQTDVLLGSLYSWGVKGAFEEAKAYLKEAYEAAGPTGSITGVSVHPYVVDPTTFPSDDRATAFGKAVTGFRTLVDSLPNGATKSLWITEIGWPVAGNQSPVSPAEQASLVNSTFNYGKANEAALRLKAVIWYNYRDAVGSNWAAYCGLRAGDGTFRPAWYEFQKQAGAVLWPLPGPTVRTAFVDASNANTVSGWHSEGSWQQIHLWGHEVAAGTRPAMLRYESTTHIFFVDATRGNRITEWSWNSVTGWQQEFIDSDPVASGSSPSAVLINGQPQIYFSDGATNRSVAVLVKSGGHWSQSRFYGDSVMANSSPSAISNNGQAQVYFADASTGNTITVWTWGATIQQSRFYGDSVMANSSPSAISNNGQSQVYFADAAKGNTITVWTWGSTIKQSFFYGDQVAASTSPSAIPNGGVPQVYFVDATINNSLALWQWGAALQQIRLYGHPAAAGSSPGR